MNRRSGARLASTKQLSDLQLVFGACTQLSHPLAKPQPAGGIARSRDIQANVCSYIVACVIQVRGCSVSDEEAAELARRLRRYEDPFGVGVAERLERGLLCGTAIVGTTQSEAKAVLTVIEQWAPDRLQDVAASLRIFISSH